MSKKVKQPVPAKKQAVGKTIRKGIAKGHLKCSMCKVGIKFIDLVLQQPIVICKGCYENDKGKANKAVIEVRTMQCLGLIKKSLTARQVKEMLRNEGASFEEANISYVMARRSIALEFQNLKPYINDEILEMLEQARELAVLTGDPKALVEVAKTYATLSGSYIRKHEINVHNPNPNTIDSKLEKMSLSELHKLLDEQEKKDEAIEVDSKEVINE